MPDEPYRIASSGYATGQLARAVAAAAEHTDPVARERAAHKVRRWQDVLLGMVSGQIHVGGRTPVVDTPAWVTLEVAHGGFATGRYLAEAPLHPDEIARLADLPDDVPGGSDRERLNLWYLGDAGQAELLDTLRAGRYRVVVPEDAALAVVAVLLHRGFSEEALDLVTELRPFLHRLRFVPRFEPVARPSHTAVRLATVAEAAESLRAVRTPAQHIAMRQTLQVWNPLYDRLVALWCRTVDGELPHLDGAGAMRGGRPCRTWPADWANERTRWLDDVGVATRDQPLTGRHAHPRSNFARLRGALVACPDGSGSLSARDVGWIRRALANTLTRHGAPDSEQRDALRTTQAATVAAPTKSAIAELVAGRLDRYPADGGLPSLESVAVDVSERDGAGGAVPDGTRIPDPLLHKAARALEAPADELVSRGVITSGEVLARVLPQLTARLMAAGIDDPLLADLYEQTYTAFRRRRGLLLLNLEHQVRFEELPWVAALAPCRSPRPDEATAARGALWQMSMLALTAFPHALVPNPLVRELGALAARTEVNLPLVEEVAADIFMGTFTTKWRDAATVTSRVMAGSLYARYYDLPSTASWSARRRSIVVQWGKRTSVDFAALCAERAREAGEAGNHVARNGAVLEQSQILTSHNLAALVDGLDMTEQLRERAPELAGRTFGWVVRRLTQRTDDWHAALIQVKNAAYAWRQAIFLLSFCDPSVQLSRVRKLRDDTVAAGLSDRFGPAVDGLAHVVDGGSFTAAGTVPDGPGRRLLGWAAGSHWYLDTVPVRADR